jgi:hypothetical protein
VGRGSWPLLSWSGLKGRGQGLELVPSGFFSDCHVEFVTSVHSAPVRRRRCVLFADLGKTCWIGDHTQGRYKRGRCRGRGRRDESGPKTVRFLGRRRLSAMHQSASNITLPPSFIPSLETFALSPSPYKCRVFAKEETWFRYSLGQGENGGTLDMYHDSTRWFR